MMRWIDVIGLLGLTLVVLGTLLLFPTSTEHMPGSTGWGASRYGSRGVRP